MATERPDIPSIQVQEQRERRRRVWWRAIVLMCALQGYYLLYPALPHPLRVSLSWLVVIPPLVPLGASGALCILWQSWRQRPRPLHFIYVPPAKGAAQWQQ